MALDFTHFPRFSSNTWPVALILGAGGKQGFGQTFTLWQRDNNIVLIWQLNLEGQTAKKTSPGITNHF